MRDDLKHLKWKLINQDGLKPDEAQARIESLISQERLQLRVKNG